MPDQVFEIVTVNKLEIGMYISHTHTTTTTCNTTTSNYVALSLEANSYNSDNFKHWHVSCFRVDNNYNYTNLSAYTDNKG